MFRYLFQRINESDIAGCFPVSRHTATAELGLTTCVQPGIGTWPRPSWTLSTGVLRVRTAVFDPSEGTTICNRVGHRISLSVGLDLH
jgi:hypothetical protein